MKSIIIAAAISAIALAGCTSQDSSPAPTVTITEQAPAPAPLPAPSVDDGISSSTQGFIDFVRANGGLYGNVADESNLISLGNTICQGFRDGLSEDEITYILAQSLVNNNMGNDDGAKFGAALIVGAKNYLCGAVY